MNTKREFWQRNVVAVVGMLVFSAGINLFIVPANLYNGGVLGISQVIRTVLVRYFHLASGTTDIAGIINMLLNIPLFVLAYVFVGKKFFFRTLVCVVSQTLFLSLIPIPAIPIVRDSLTASIIGGIFGGTGIGIALQSGGSSGGLDIVGMIFTKRFKGFSVGKVSLSVNAVIYIVCAVLFGLQTAVYSIIYSAVSMLMTDRAHTQNINTEVVIFTKKEPLKIIDYIVNEYHRDATWWEAKGGYTEENTYMVIVVLSKYECAHLKRELKEVVKHREIARAKRERNAVPVVAIVGYTNAGKSTLLNHLTDAEVLEEDKLFATLDPTTRMLELEGHQQVLLTDTVGFIRKLPHHLIEAFKSTLEEAKYADYIIHVVDASNPQRDKQMYIVYETLDHLGVKNKKILTLFNKIDIRTDDDPLQDFRADHVLQISAAENAGLDAVKDVLQEMLREDKIYIERVIPYAQAGVLQLVRNKGELVSEEYVPEGISIRAYVPMEVYGKL